MLRPPISSHHPIPSISSYLIRCHSHVCTTPFVPWSQNIGYFHQFSGLSFHACRIPASVMLGFAPPEKSHIFSMELGRGTYGGYHVPSHIVPLFLLIYPPLDWRSDGQSTMKMNSPRSHGFYIAILIVRYITIKSLSQQSGRILDILNILEFPWDYTTP